MGAAGKRLAQSASPKQKDDAAQMLEQLAQACESCGIPYRGRDFSCRVLAILHSYGGGPGGEYFRLPLARQAAMKAGALLDEAVLKKDWDFIRAIQEYVAQLRADNAPWLAHTLDLLEIPAKEFVHKECL